MSHLHRFARVERALLWLKVSCMFLPIVITLIRLPSPVEAAIAVFGGKYKYA